MTASSVAGLIDLTGLRCPLPLLKIKQHLHRLPPGSQCRFRVDDVGTRQDVPLFLHHAGHVLLETEIEGTITEFFIQRG